MNCTPFSGILFHYFLFTVKGDIILKKIFCGLLTVLFMLITLTSCITFSVSPPSTSSQTTDESSSILDFDNSSSESSDYEEFYNKYEDAEYEFEDITDETTLSAMDAVEKSLFDGTISGYISTNSLDNTPGVTISISLNPASYDTKDKIAEEFITCSEIFLKKCEGSFLYSDVCFMFYMDKNMIAMLSAQYENEKFTSGIAALYVSQEDYSVSMETAYNNSLYFQNGYNRSFLDSVSEIFGDNVSTEVNGNQAIFSIPIESPTAEDLYSAAYIFFDEEACSNLITKIAASKAFADAINIYTFRFTTKDGEKIMDIILISQEDSVFDYTTDYDFNEDFIDIISEVTDMID